MIKKSNLNEIFREAKDRIDGAVTLIWMKISLVAPVLVAGYGSIFLKLTNLFG